MCLRELCMFTLNFALYLCNLRIDNRCHVSVVLLACLRHGVLSTGAYQLAGIGSSKTKRVPLIHVCRRSRECEDGKYLTGFTVKL